MRNIIFLFCLLCLISCKKESIITPALLIDSIPENRYYDKEIMTNDNLRIYGQWIFLNTYDYAGIIGGPGKLDPAYDYLEIKKYGIYGMIKDNLILESGKIEIIEQDSLKLKIRLYSGKNDSSLFAHNIWYVHYQGLDSIIMYDAAIGCGSFSNVFRRKN